jgi:hypothetical protein
MKSQHVAESQHVVLRGVHRCRQTRVPGAPTAVWILSRPQEVSAGRVSATVKLPGPDQKSPSRDQMAVSSDRPRTRTTVSAASAKPQILTASPTFGAQPVAERCAWRGLPPRSGSSSSLVDQAARRSLRGADRVSRGRTWHGSGVKAGDLPLSLPAAPRLCQRSANGRPNPDRGWQRSSPPPARQICASLSHSSNAVTSDCPDGCGPQQPRTIRQNRVTRVSAAAAA